MTNLPRGGHIPRPDALKKRGNWTVLPRECELPIPPWPSALGRPLPTELTLWRKLWRRPVAHLWHRDWTLDLVALYVRAYIEAAQPDAPTPGRQFVRMMADSLMLSSGALQKLYFVVEGTAEAESVQQVYGRNERTVTRLPTDRPKARDRARVQRENAEKGDSA